MLELVIVVVSLFAIVDPLAAIPPFAAFFGKSSASLQHKAAKEASLAAFFLLVIFSALGHPLLTTLGISIPAFLIAGGILLLILSFDFLRGELPLQHHTEKDTADAAVPIGTPFLAGPGAITASIYFNHVYGPVITIAGIVVVMTLSFLCLFYSSCFIKHLGKNGLKILTRIMGLLTAAIAISFVERALTIYGIIRI
ncbi:MAG: MarC family protein [Candidatus Aenigmarchaeota archaeon]|nr:MarC family protein [Candidatus Aenigmarchaeota archaeon]